MSDESENLPAPMTEAEMEELMNAPQGESILSIIEEFEEKYIVA